MKQLFDTELPEPSGLTGFARNTLVRDSENRDGETLAKALADASARWHLFAACKAVVRKGENPGATLGMEEARQFSPDLERAVLLGADERGPRLAAPVALEGDPAEPYQLYDFRSLLYSSAVSD